MKSTFLLLLVLFEMTFGYPLIKLQQKNFDYSKIKNKKSILEQLIEQASVKGNTTEITLSTELLSTFFNKFNNQEAFASTIVSQNVSIACTSNFASCCCCCC